jgi:hypothetical protein
MLFVAASCRARAHVLLLLLLLLLLVKSTPQHASTVLTAPPHLHDERC